jgi:hypothetical protein
MDVVKGDERINSTTPEMECNQTAMGLPPFTTAVLIAKSFKNVGVSVVYL